MRVIYDIAIFTFKEGLRHKILYGVVVFASLMICLSVLLSGMFMRDISKILLDVCLSAVSLGGLLIPFFLAINLIAYDLESRTVYSILSLPVSRSKYILGKYFGLCLLILLIMGVLTIATFLAIQGGVFLFSAYYFSSISIASILIAVAIAALGNMVLLGCVFLWSSVTTSAFLVTLLTLATYIIGQTIEEIVRFMAAQTAGVSFSPIFKKAIEVILYIFPNLASFDLKQQAAHAQILSLQHTSLLIGYGLAYIGVMLGLTIFFFARRDLS